MDRYDEILTEVARGEDPRVRAAIRTAGEFKHSLPMMRTVNLPIRGEVIFDRSGVEEYSIRGCFSSPDPAKIFNTQAFYSTLELRSARDQATVIQVLFDRARDEAMYALAARAMNGKT